MIDENIKTEILRRLQAAETEHGVKVLYAIESGSRAWGFASPNSDYDVRFIYAHPKDWYVAVDLEEKRDVIEYDIVDDIDINGWDVRKALRLFNKSNPAFIEWLQSPIVYVENGSFAQQARKLMPAIYSIEKGIYHYRSMAKTTYRTHLKADQVHLKKYFYALRPLLSIRWLEQYQAPAPIEFAKLRTLLADNQTLNAQIEHLLERKKQSLEKEFSAPVSEINAFIESELAQVEKYGEHPSSSVNKMPLLNSLFHEVLRQQ
ncbi:nucleotidyltransferase domain-containing protein [Thiolinea disciformis]|uniref:nucleotidyltransferase domain-containing protein n=1 Tax=Thiolinea disciformis TaxID=125614 RepID=UPI00035F7E4B|nr:nucleotidyltransferase domain-containing protein [Thiolinea disciformis]